MSEQAGFDLVLEITPRYAQAEARQRYRQRMRVGLDEVGIRVRPLAWSLFILIALGALLLPAWQRFGGTDTDAKLASAAHNLLPSQFDKVWSSGPISRVHAHFEGQCSLCHESAFQSVGDAQCLSCHEDTAAHGRTSGDPEPAASVDACTRCHLEHQPNHQITLDSAGLCTSCHANPDSSEVPKANGFGLEHPDFSVLEEPASSDAAGSGVKFNHALHLDKEGVKSPSETRVMECSDCHNSDRTGGFDKPNMEAHCSDCHVLNFDDERPELLMPHGDLALLNRELEQIYAEIALETTELKVDALRHPPGQREASQLEDARVWAKNKAADMLQEQVQRRSCETCHTVSDSEPGSALPFSLASVSFPEQYLAGSRFDHRHHRTQSCSDCHTAESSELATDVLLPGKAQCVSCHGRASDDGEGLSSCLQCHNFHGSQVHWPSDVGATP